MVTFQDYLNHLKSNVYKPRVKIEWLRQEDESVSSSFVGDVMSGTLTINKQNGCRRSVNMTLKNIDGQYIPNEYGIWIRTLFKLSLGFNINGEDFFIPQGVFVISDPETISSFSSSTVSIAGFDKFALLDGQLGGDLDYIYQIPIGTNVLTAIKAILSESGDKKLPVLQRDFINEVTPYTIRKEISGTLGEILIELSGLLSSNIYYNEEGILVFEKDTNDTTKGSEWDYSTNDFTYLGATKSYKFSEVYNAVKVIGTNINGNIVTGEAINNNLQSSTRVQLLPKRTKVIEDNLISTDARALARARYELKQLVSIQNSVSIKSIPMFHLDVDKVITLTDSKLKDNKERYLIQSINIPFEVGGQMSVSCVKADDLGFLG